MSSLNCCFMKAMYSALRSGWIFVGLYDSGLLRYWAGWCQSMIE